MPDQYPVSIETAQLLACKLYLGQLDTTQIQSYANDWLNLGYYSASLSEIFYGAEHIEELFSLCLTELGARTFQSRYQAAYYLAFRTLEEVQNTAQPEPLLNASYKLLQISETYLTQQHHYDTFAEHLNAKGIIEGMFRLEHEVEIESNRQQSAAEQLREAVRTWIAMHPQGLPIDN